MLLYILVGSALPYIEGLDSWIYNGVLDDPYEEVSFALIVVILILEVRSVVNL